MFILYSSAQAQDSLWVRKYQLALHNQYDLRNSSTNLITTNRVLHDVFRKSIKSNMGEKLGNISYGVFSFSVSYLTMVWSHEFGHSLRAEQVGGHFKFHNAALPFPYTTMHLPSDISLTDESLSVTAGFEVNYLNVRSIQQEFILQNGIYNEDLAFSFANRMMYSIYTSIIVPINPKEKEVWINTAGDPVHIALPVFKNYSNNQVFMPDSTVNSALVNYYNKSALLGSFFNLLDPQFYRELGAAFGKNKSRRPVFIVGDYKNGWTYGTLFNTSPLGYELYMNNYIHFNDYQFSVYFKYGNPYKNNGIGILWNNMLSNKNINVSGKVEAWDQDLFGNGISGELIMDWKLSNHFGTSVTTSYKTEGYLLGKQVAKGFNLGVGFVYYAKY